MRIRPLVVVAALAAAFLTAATTPASADPVEVEATVSPTEVQPGDTFTVTETVHNLFSFSILNPTLRLFSTPTTLPSYVDLVGCSGAGATCTTVNDVNTGAPIGFQAILPEAMSGFTSATVVFTFRVKSDAVGAVHTLQGQLHGRNYAIFPVNVGTLTVITEADVAVGITATPKFGLLVPKLEVTVRVTNNGPGTLRSAEIRGSMTQGLNASAGSKCSGDANPVCTFGELAAGASTTGKFTIPLGLLHIGLPFQISAAKTASSPTDPHAGNNSASTTCTVITPLLVSCG